MTRYLAWRLLSMLLTGLGVSILIFALIRFIPGDVVDQIMGSEARAGDEHVQALRRFFGLDAPLGTQYGRWVGGVLRGDLGVSWRSGTPVMTMILERFGVTLELAFGAMLVAVTAGLSLGVLAALRANGTYDHLARVGALLSLSMPIFWQAALLLLILVSWFGWTPPLGYVGPRSDLRANVLALALPWLVLGTASAAQIMRMARSSILDVLRQDYVRTARAKGLPNRVVVWRHALRNALIPVVTVAGLQVGHLLGGAVVTEEVFALPGVGRLLLNAIYQRDYPIVQGTILFVSAFFMLANLAVDLLYGLLDPTIRYE